MLIIEYLKSHSLLDLMSEHGVNFRFDNKCSKFSLNYDQILVKNGDKLAEECRGLILRPINPIQQIHSIVGNCKILASCMHRFYNNGDHHCTNIDFNSSKIYEKLDGTMTLLYYDDLFSKWCVGTRSVCEADLNIKEGDIERDITFYDLFMKGLKNTLKNKQTIDDFLNSLDKDNTYIFELTSPLNRIVVDYKETSVTLIAIKNNVTNQEMSINNLELINVNIPRPKIYNLHTLEAIKAFANEQNPINLEGFVLCDKNFNRCKIKNTNYVLAHKTKFSINSSKRNIVIAILSEKIDDIIPMLSQEAQEKIELMQNILRNFIIEEQKRYDMWKNDAVGDVKTFAGFVNVSNTPITNVHFNIWRNKTTSVKKGLQQLINQNKFTDSICDRLIKFLFL